MCPSDVLATIHRAQAAQRAYYRRTHIQLALGEEHEMNEQNQEAATAAMTKILIAEAHNDITEAYDAVDAVLANTDLPHDVFIEVSKAKDALFRARILTDQRP